MQTYINAWIKSQKPIPIYFLFTFRAGRYIACDSHAHLVSKAGSLISG